MADRILPLTKILPRLNPDGVELVFRAGKLRTQGREKEILGDLPTLRSVLHAAGCENPHEIKSIIEVRILNTARACAQSCALTCHSNHTYYLIKTVHRLVYYSFW